MNLAVVGTGYVGLVTGVVLSEIGHNVTCIDNDALKIHKLRAGTPTIYEPGLQELLKKNVAGGRLHFTTDMREGVRDREVLYIAVGTPERADGSADLKFVEQVTKDVVQYISRDMIIVTKSTVPIGTNVKIKQWILEHLKINCKVHVVSNPEFLREGSAISDAFHGDRIVIGAENEESASKIEEINKPLGIPIFKTDLESAELIKYASNAFLATKISFINEIATLSEMMGANIDDVAVGMGMDHRIGNKFLNAGIGFGGSCFSKDVKAMIHTAKGTQCSLRLLQSVMELNYDQQRILISKVKNRFGNLKNKRVALLGLAFKPGTDDMREAPSLVIIEQLLQEGAVVIGYDPAAMENCKKIVGVAITYADSIEQALSCADVAMILTEWDEFKSFDLTSLKNLMNEPILFDGRNCFTLESAREAEIEYISIGRRPSEIKIPVN